MLLCVYQGSGSSDGSSYVGAAVGGTVAAVLFMMLVAVLLLVIWYYVRQQKRHGKPITSDISNKGWCIFVSTMAKQFTYNFTLACMHIIIMSVASFKIFDSYAI